MRVSKEELERIVRRLSERTGRAFELDYMPEGVRFGTRGRHISTRMSKREMRVWLEAFENGLEFSGAEKMKLALDTAPALPDVHLTEATPKTAADFMQWGATYNEWYTKDRAEASNHNC